MPDSCEHSECQRAQNASAALAVDDVNWTSVDLADVDPGLRPFSLDCKTRTTLVYQRDEITGHWFMVAAGLVTDRELIRKLEAAAELQSGRQER
jgi:hypothetical protein